MVLYEIGQWVLDQESALLFAGEIIIIVFLGVLAIPLGLVLVTCIIIALRVFIVLAAVVLSYLGKWFLDEFWALSKLVSMMLGKNAALVNRVYIPVQRAVSHVWDQLWGVLGRFMTLGEPRPYEPIPQNGILTPSESEFSDSSWDENERDGSHLPLS